MDAINDSMLSHGRGIAMARSVFDEIRYNTTGNQVLLIKRFSTQA
jgi:anti-sigma regulatory factor (Ser/Thr protein kinase)